MKLMAQQARYSIVFLLSGTTPIFAQTSAPPDPPPPPFMQPPPGLSNGCGRTGPIFLRPIPSTHKIAPYPQEAIQDHEEGRALLRVVVDKEGYVKEATIIRSSGYTDLDEAALISVKENWQWEPPPAECAEMGVVLPAFYDWHIPTSAPEQR